MFLALGVGAWAAGIFHLVTHAFFKALLFLAAGAVIHCLHHEHNIFKMGGLRVRLPVVFWSFVIGSAALAALPFTSGFFSKDMILLKAYELPGAGPWLWAGGLLGALLTAIYSFRLVFVVFFGEVKTEPDKSLGVRMALPLSLLCVLSIIGGWFALPLSSVFPDVGDHHPSHLVEGVSIAIPLIGLAIAYLVFLGGQLNVDNLVNSSLGQMLKKFWFSGWAIDWLYDKLWVQPYKFLAHILKRECIDDIYNTVVRLCQFLFMVLSRTQTGRLRWYATSMVFGLILVIVLLQGGI